MISATIVADSVHAGARITTMQLRYPRIVHDELLTHRAFSRNSSSARAIPVERLIEDVLQEPARPVQWGCNQPGMQARRNIEPQLVPFAVEAWDDAMRDAVKHARQLAKLGLHKQIVNRVLWPFQHINVVVTSTDWDNFFKLRLHVDADPTICQLAGQMLTVLNYSRPRELAEGEWHLPFAEGGITDHHDAIMVSAARCARTSYLTHDGLKTDPVKDGALAGKLLQSRHMSPFEHQATPAAGRHANFTGWRSYRTELGF